MGFHVDIKALNGITEMILRHGENAENKAPKVLKAGADVLIAAHKSELASMRMTERSAGTLAGSIGMKAVRVTKASVHTDVFPQGSQPHGHPRKGKRGNVTNAQVGFMLEHGYMKGQAHVPGRRWMAAANAKAEDAVHDAMAEAWEAVQLE